METNILGFFGGSGQFEDSSLHGEDDEEEETIWVDDTSAIAVAKADEIRPKSRQYALRWFRVKEHAEKICFCPTGLMRADGLTKVEIAPGQRRLLLHNYEPGWEDPGGAEDQGGDELEEEVGVHFVRVFAGDSVGFWIL